jgi:UDP-N-acetylglucosamine 3-dehydrogenase
MEHRMMECIKVAVLGCGVWGSNHARVFSEIPEAELVCVADLDVSRAKRIGGFYNTEWTCDCEEVFQNPEVDAISICTPTVTHADLGLRAIEGGKHVLVEKPMTNTLDEANTLIRAADRMGVHLSVGFVERFNPAVTRAFQLIEEGEIGDVILAHTRRVSRRPQRIGDVGVVKDLAIHDIDIISNLFPSTPEFVFCTAGSLEHAFEDYANINLRYHGNRNAFIETNWLTPRKVRTLTITGSEGIITVEYITQELTLEKNERMTRPFLPYQEPLYLELYEFTQAIIKDEEPVVTGEDGLKALRICESALKSAKTGETVSFKKVEEV